VDDLEKHLIRANRRYQTFIKGGMKPRDASDLVDKMFVRDTEGGDDRRVCYECRHLDRTKCLALPEKPDRFSLRRCTVFEVKK